MCAMALMLAGCNLFDPRAPYCHYPSYTVKFATFPGESDEMKWRIHLAELYMDHHGSMVQIGIGGGILQSAPSRVPDQVVMKWTDPNGEAKEQSIILTGVVTDMGHFEGTFWFLYRDGRWVVRPVTKEQAVWRAVHGASTAPVDESG